MKLDIEGEEMLALHGARTLFKRRGIGTPQLEYNAPWLRAGWRLCDLFDFAHEVEYSLVVLTPFGAALTPTCGEGVEDYRLGNFALVRPDHLAALRPIQASGRFLVEAIRASFEPASQLREAAADAD